MLLHISLLWLVVAWAALVSASHSRSSSISTDEEKKVVGLIEVKEKDDKVVQNNKAVQDNPVVQDNKIVIYLEACNKIVDQNKLSTKPEETALYKRFQSCTSACLYTVLGEDILNPPTMLGESQFLLAIQDSKIPDHILDLADERLIHLATLARHLTRSRNRPFNVVKPCEDLIARPLKTHKFLTSYLFEHTNVAYAQEVLPAYRYAHKVVGDGNCLYRSFLFGLVILYSKRSNSPRWAERMQIDAVLHDPNIYGTNSYVTLGLDLISHVLMFAPFYDSSSWRTILNDSSASDIMVYALRAITGHYLNTTENRKFLNIGFDEYLAHTILTMGEWGGQVEVSCLAQAFNVVVAVTDLIGKRRILTNDLIALETPGDIELLYNGVHYDLLIL